MSIFGLPLSDALTAAKASAPITLGLWVFISAMIFTLTGHGFSKKRLALYCAFLLLFALSLGIFTGIGEVPISPSYITENSSKWSKCIKENINGIGLPTKTGPITYGDLSEYKSSCERSEKIVDTIAKQRAAISANAGAR